MVLERVCQIKGVNAFASPTPTSPNESSNVTRTFEGKRALVTGAGRGIGRALSLGLAGAGARVAILARSQDELDEVADVIADLGGTALVIKADVGDPDQVAHAASVALAEFGTVDVLINNAGVVWPLGPTSGVDPAEWAAAIGINLVGPVALTHALLPAMLARGCGRIVNLSPAESPRDPKG